MMRTQFIPILVVASLPAAPTSLTGAEARPGKWEILFDGKSVDKWRGYKMNSFPNRSWKVENGAIIAIAGADGRALPTA